MENPLYTIVVVKKEKARLPDLMLPRSVFHATIDHFEEHDFFVSRLPVMIQIHGLSSQFFSQNRGRIQPGLLRFIRRQDQIIDRFMLKKKDNIRPGKLRENRDNFFNFWDPDNQLILGEFIIKSLRSISEPFFQKLKKFCYFLADRDQKTYNFGYQILLDSLRGLAVGLPPFLKEKFHIRCEDLPYTKPGRRLPKGEYKSRKGFMGQIEEAEQEAYWRWENEHEY